jgi:hypothetical protein
MAEYDDEVLRPDDRWALVDYLLSSSSADFPAGRRSSMKRGSRR